MFLNVVSLFVGEFALSTNRNVDCDFHALILRKRNRKQKQKHRDSVDKWSTNFDERPHRRRTCHPRGGESILKPRFRRDLQNSHRETKQQVHVNDFFSLIVSNWLQLERTQIHVSHNTQLSGGSTQFL